MCRVYALLIILSTPRPRSASFSTLFVCRSTDGLNCIVGDGVVMVVVVFSNLEALEAASMEYQRPLFKVLNSLVLRRVSLVGNVRVLWYVLLEIDELQTFYLFSIVWALL